MPDADPDPRPPWPWQIALRRHGATALFAAGLVLPCALLLILTLRNSLTWSYWWDLPPLLYAALLVEHFGWVPYRDFFDMNFIGSHLSYAFIGTVFGYSDLGIRVADITWILAIMVGTALVLRNLGTRVWMLAPFLFPLFYLREGARMTLQREIVGLPWIVFGVATATVFVGRYRPHRAAIAGLFFGIAAMIKPHLVLGLPAVVVAIASEHETDVGWRAWARDVVRLALWSAAGLAIPVGLVFLILLWHGALDDFVDLLTHYLPLYAQLTGELEVLAPAQYRSYVAQSFLDVDHNIEPVLIAGMLGLTVGVLNGAYTRAQRRQVELLLVLGLVYWVYPVFSGHFWWYHYYPFAFFMCAGIALIFGPWSAGASAVQRVGPALVVGLMCMQIYRPHKGFRPVLDDDPATRMGGRPAAVARFLKRNLEPGDRVQPVDIVSGGMVHGMLRARAELATPFLYWFHFYHHVDDPFIVDLRGRLMASLRAAPPRYVLESQAQDYWVRGKRSAPDFVAFDRFLKEHYRAVRRGDGYVIWEVRRRGRPVAPPPDEAE